MANKFDKALNTTPKAKKKPWWVIHVKKYSYPIWALPIIPFCLLADKITEVADKNRKWSDKRTEKIITYVFAKIAEVDKTDGSLTHPFREWWCYNVWANRARWCDIKYCKKFNKQIQEYLYNTFEMEGYTKTVEEEDNHEWTWVTFTKNN